MGALLQPAAWDVTRNPDMIARPEAATLAQRTLENRAHPHKWLPRRAPHFCASGSVNECGIALAVIEDGAADPQPPRDMTGDDGGAKLQARGAKA